MEGVKQINAIMVCPNQQAEFVPLQDLYAMEVDRTNRNCYNCGGFRHIARQCRNRGTEERIREERRLRYRENRNNRQRLRIEGGNRQKNNLNRDKNLIALN